MEKLNLRNFFGNAEYLEIILYICSIVRKKEKYNAEVKETR